MNDVADAIDSIDAKTGKAISARPIGDRVRMKSPKIHNPTLFSGDLRPRQFLYRTPGYRLWDRLPACLAPSDAQARSLSHGHYAIPKAAATASLTILPW